MGDQNLRVWPVEGDSYGDVIEYPAYAKYRMEPHWPGATGDTHTDLVVYTRDDTEERGEHELGRHRSSDVLIAYAGQPTPAAVAEREHERTATVGRDETTSSASSASNGADGSPVYELAAPTGTDESHNH